MSKAITIYPEKNYKASLFKRVAVYCRESSKNKHQLESIGSQISSLCETVVKTPFWELQGVYVDVHTGSTMKGRDQLHRMLSNCNNGQVDIVLVRNVSRLSRNTVDSLNITRDLKSKGIETIFRDDNISTMDMEGELILTLIGAIAQAENQSRSLNIRWGVKRAVQSGRSVLFRRKCYGYQTDDEGNMLIQEDEAENVRMIFDSYLNGNGVVTIQHQLKERGIKSPSGNEDWCKRSIETILDNEKYYGAVCVYKSYQSDSITPRPIRNRGEHAMYFIVDHHEPIISKELFARVQAERAKRAKREPLYYLKAM